MLGRAFVSQDMFEADVVCSFVASSVLLLGKW
jgi:hypothetical protein